jgi:hypothetical protein
VGHQQGVTHPRLGLDSPAQAGFSLSVVLFAAGHQAVQQGAGYLCFGSS